MAARIPQVNLRIIQELNAGVIDANAFSAYICDIVGSEHYNDNLRQLRGTAGFALVAAPNVQLPAIGTTARAYDTVIAPGGANDPNQGGLRPLNNCDANFDGGEVDGEELWVLFGLGIETRFPLQTVAAGAVRSDSMERMGRAVEVTMFSNSRDLSLGAIADWPTVKGGGGVGAVTRNGFTDTGQRAFRPVALKPSTRFHVEYRVCDTPEIAIAAELPLNPLVDYTSTFQAWRMNIRETFGNAQCANLFR